MNALREKNVDMVTQMVSESKPLSKCFCLVDQHHLMHQVSFTRSIKE